MQYRANCCALYCGVLKYYGTGNHCLAFISCKEKEICNILVIFHAGEDALAADLMRVTSTWRPVIPPFYRIHFLFLLVSSLFPLPVSRPASSLCLAAFFSSPCPPSLFSFFHHRSLLFHPLPFFLSPLIFSLISPARRRHAGVLRILKGHPMWDH